MSQTHLNDRGGSRNFCKSGPRSYKILERGVPKSLKMAFECSFQSFSYKSFANIIPKGGGGRGGWVPPLNLPLNEVVQLPTYRWYFAFDWLSSIFCKIFISLIVLQMEGQKFLAENSASVYIQKVCELPLCTQHSFWLAGVFCIKYVAGIVQCTSWIALFLYMYGIMVLSLKNIF